MSNSFDPYRKWLGIPPKDQPPNHYRLLGIELFESDPDVISNAADARMAHIRTFQTGPYSEWSQKLLNEIAAAKLCLLNPEKKAEYDAQLQAQLAAQGLWPPASGSSGISVAIGGEAIPGTSSALPSSFSLGSIPYAIPLESGGQSALSSSEQEGPPLSFPTCSGGGGARLGRRRSRAWPLPAFLGLGAVGVVGLLVLLIWMVQWERSPTAQVGPSGFGPFGNPVSKGPVEKTPAIGTSPSPGPKVSKPCSKEKKPAGKSSSSESKGIPGPSVAGGVPAVAGTKEKSSKTSPAPESAEQPSESKPFPHPPTAPFSEKQPSVQPKIPEPTGKEAPRPSEVNPIAKRPPPPKEELSQAEEEILDVLKEDFAEAEKTGAASRLAGKLLQHALETSDSPADQYMLFQLAAEWAVRGADDPLLEDVLEAWAQRFEIDRQQMLIEVLEKAAIAPAEEKLRQARVELMENLVEELLAEDKYQGAERVAKAALAASRESTDPDWQRQIKAWAGKIERLAQQYAKLQEYFQKLAQNPDDPEANLAVGQWYAFQAGRWEKAVCYLAKGGQAELAEAARLDLQGPQTPADQQKLGDLWWQLSEKASGEERFLLQGRAAYWYEKALPTLAGLSKTLAQRRIETYQTLLGQKEPISLKKADYVLQFDGQKTYAFVPNFLYDGNKPMTVEVILTPASAQHDGAIIGNMLGMGGWMLAIASPPRPRIAQQRFWVFFLRGRFMHIASSEDPVETGQRVMLAAVFDGSEIRLFVNGRRQFNTASVFRHRPGLPKLLIGASASSSGGLTNFFHGTIEQIRISFTVRYTTHFTPPERLEKDKDTELLLHFNTGRGTAVRDLSGARRAARIVAGKWIKRSHSP